MLVLGHRSKGENLPWTFVESSNRMYLLIPADATKNDAPLDSGDVVAAFDESDQCMGLIKWVGAKTTLTVHGFTNYTAEISFKVWDKQKDCIYQNVAYTSDAWNGTFDTTTTYFQLASFAVTSDSIIYTTSLSTGDEPTYLVEDMDESFTFENYEELDIDTESGLITPSNSVAGEYTLSVYSSEFCLSNPKTSLLITSEEQKNYVLSPYSDSPEYQTIYFSQEGKIKILDVHGMTVNTIKGPGEWDGTNQSGELVSNAEYYLLFEDGSTKTITVIK